MFPAFVAVNPQGEFQGLITRKAILGALRGHVGYTIAYMSVAENLNTLWSKHSSEVVNLEKALEVAPPMVRENAPLTRIHEEFYNNLVQNMLVVDTSFSVLGLISRKDILLAPSKSRISGSTALAVPAQRIQVVSTGRTVV